MRRKIFDAAVIGGGFYGSMLALFLAREKNKVILIEKEKDLLLRASYNNQARVHNGYHYPRSFMTAIRSHANYRRFTKDFKNAVDKSVLMLYAIASNFSKTTGQQFVKFTRQINSPIFPAPPKIKRLFNENLIEEVFQVEELVFNAQKLRKILKEALRLKGVKVLLESEVTRVMKTSGENIALHFKKGKTLLTKRALNCTYSGINTLLGGSGLPILPFKYELAEMPLVVLPEVFNKFGVTVIDGPFFGFLPFPAKRVHALYHVRYSPHKVWLDHIDGGWNKKKIKTRYTFMIKDAARFIPELKRAEYADSLYEIRTVLAEYEVNDARPILFKKDYGIPGFHIVMGGKLDNIYDILEEIKHLS